MPKITAFVARSFDPRDEQKIEPILKFLNSFRAAGFLAESAEQAEVESVSQKVRRMIDGADVFVGIFTRRHPVYDPKSLWRAAVPFMRNRLVAGRWVAPPWVIQESGYALKAIASKKKMILFRERDVELPSLQGDLEYIEFAEADFVAALQKASEMINDLLAEASGTVVETVVSSSPAAVEAEPAAPATEPEKPAAATNESARYYFRMKAALATKEWDEAKNAYEGLLKIVSDEDPSDKLFWEAHYQELRYCAGQADSLEALKVLAEENPKSPDPLSALSNCFYRFQEYEKSADYSLRAARLADGDQAVNYRIFAAKALKGAGKVQEAVKLLLAARRGVGPYAGSTGKLEKELYALLKEHKDSYEAFAVGEWTLHENPGDRDFRFSIAYDYESEDFGELSVFHYRLLRQNDPDDQNVLNNLGASYAKLKLPILAVDSYRDAYRKGNTLAANNLARSYSEAGFTSDAATIIREAMQKENYEQQLPGTLAMLNESRKGEEAREESFLESSDKHRAFLLLFGEGFFQETPHIDGTWHLPDGDIALTLSSGILSGAGRVTI